MTINLEINSVDVVILLILLVCMVFAIRRIYHFFTED